MKEFRLAGIGTLGLAAVMTLAMLPSTQEGLPVEVPAARKVTAEQSASRAQSASSAQSATFAHTAPAGQPTVSAQSTAPARSAARVQSAPSVQEIQEPPPQRRRWWSRNRYPGPIPTPEEWEPPDGPVRIGLQVGHWRANEAPRELSGLRGNGARWNGTHEWEFNIEIARHAGSMLEELGYTVDILPAVVPPGYRAHLFIAIHADGSNDPGARGYRVSAPRRDATGRAQDFVDLLYRTYGPATGMRRLSDTTRRMRNYYAFNYRRYEHALHPMTIAAIIETGFLTNAGDRAVIMNQPERVARGIVDAITRFPITPPPGRAPR